MSGGRTIYGNLFAESTWARTAAAMRKERGRKAPSPLDPRFQPSEETLHVISALATLLRAAADDGDRLWTPKPVDPARIPDVAGLARPECVSGSRPSPTPADVSWAESTDAATIVNDRRFALQIAQENGLALPGASSADWIDDAIRGIEAAAEASPHGTWIAKAVHSSSGRARTGGKGAAVDAQRRRAVENLIDIYGAVVIEPWVPRLADFGSTAVASANGADPDAKVHGLASGSRGEFEGIDLGAPITGEEQAALVSSTALLAAALAAAGYTGPFGVDAFRWRDRDGRERFHALCECNARWTMGRVARLLRDRIAPHDPAFRLRVGGADDLANAGRSAAFDCVPLLLPGPPDGTAAWAEISVARRGEL